MRDRQAAERLGRRGEWVAALWLMAKGYRIQARRVRTGQGEIDLVARKGRRLIFVEVKLRARIADAGEAIGPRQRRRIERAALAYCARRGLGDPAMRFDAVLLAPFRLPVHVKDAWRES